MLFYVERSIGRVNIDILSLANMLAKRGFDIHFMCLETSCHKDYSHVNNIPLKFKFYTYPYLKKFKGVNIFFIFALISNMVYTLKIVKKAKANIILSSSVFWVLMPSFFVSKVFRTPLIIYCRELLLERFPKTFFYRLLDLIRTYIMRHSSLLLSMDYGIKIYFEKRLQRKVNYIPPCVDLDLLEKFRSEKKSYRKKLNLSESDILILYAGELNPYRRLDLLIFAFYKLLKEFPNARLVLCGYGQKKYINKLVTKLGISDKVHLLGWLPYSEVLSLISCADICVDPFPRSGVESFQFSLKLLEYMLLGKCICTTNVPGNRQLIINNYNGILVSPNNYVELAQALKRICEDKDLREKLARGALTMFHKKFSGSLSLQQLTDVLIKILGLRK